MLRTAGPTAFLATADRNRARTFYEGVLGLDFVGDETFALVFDLAGTTLRVTQVDHFEAQPFTVLGWSVEDVAAAVGWLSSLGVAFERFAGLEQDDNAIWTAPSGTRIAWFRDPDGNLLSVSQHPGGEGHHGPLPST